MELLSGQETARRVSGLINAKYQIHRFSVHLTVGNIYALDPVGQVDFGGSEYSPAARTALSTVRRNPEDTYEWWDLSRGRYQVEFNESLNLADDELGLLEPEERLLRAGGSHVTLSLRGKIERLESPLVVETLRMQIKKNARISRLRIFRFKPTVKAAPAGGRRRSRSPKKVARRRWAGWRCGPIAGPMLEFLRSGRSAAW